jgi:hypothetical protein
MNNHLSSEQFARCFAGVATSDERLHIGECPECRKELERLGGAISSFRSAVRGRVEERITSDPALVSPSPSRSWKWRPALATAAAILLGIFPFLMTERELPHATVKPPDSDPNALMQAVGIHLSRTLPAPMQPVMALLPHQESNESGGVQ